MQIGHKYNFNSNADPAARIYLNAANIVPGQIYAGDGVNDYPLNSERIIDATTRLVISLKGAGIWSKIRHMLLMNGNTSGNCLTNLMHPGFRDAVSIGSTAATFVRKGLSGSGNVCIDTGILLSEFNEYDISAGIYFYGNGGYTFGAANSNGGTYIFGLVGLTAYFKSTAGLTATGYPTTGLSVINITAANRKTLYIRGVQAVLDTTTSSTAVHNSDFRNIYLNQVNFSGTPTGGGNINPIGLFFMSSGLSDADNVALAPILNRFMFDIRGRDYGETIYNGLQGLGDSIMAGTAGTGYHTYMQHVGYNRNCSILNYAVGGTTIVDCNNTQINSLLPKDANHTKVIIAYSTNDFIHDYQSGGVNMNLAMFSSNFDAVYGKILALGYSPSDIMLITGYYVNAPSIGVGADALQDQYIAKSYERGINAGIPYQNIRNYKQLQFQGGRTPGITGIHPTSSEHDYIGEDLSTYMINIIF